MNQKRRNFQIYIFVVLFILLKAVVSAQPPSHCLWEISTGESRIYLLGSIHALSRSDYPLADEIEQAFQNSRKIYFELDMDSVSTLSVQQQIMMAGMLQGKTLKDVLSDSTYQNLSVVLSRYHMTVEMVQMFKPWMIATLLTVAQLNALDIDPEYGIDQYFFRKSKAEGKSVGSMESVADQLRCFRALEGKLAEPMLLQTINSLDLIETEFQEMKQAWKSGDTMSLDSLMNSQIKDFPELKKILLDHRNTRWLTRVEKMMERRENALVIVGAGHLVGDGSLTDLLRRKGFVLRQR